MSTVTPVELHRDSGPLEDMRAPLEIIKWKTKNGFPPKNAPCYDARAFPLEKAMGTHKIQGDRFQGKSALGETICFMLWNTGATIYDIYAANDQENAAWLESPCADYVTLLVGSNCSLTFDHKQYKFMKAIDLDPSKQGMRNIYVACKRFFQTEDDYYKAMWNLSDKFKTRTTYDWVDVIFLREAQEVITGVMRAGVARSEKDAATAFIRFHNTLFHFGYAVVLDSQRDVEVSKSVRELADWNYFKNMGGLEIPHKYWHTFRKADPDRMYRELEKWQFILYAKGKVGLGVNLQPDWHINRGRDLLLKLGIHEHFEGSPNTPVPTLSGQGGPGRPKEFGVRHEIEIRILGGKSYTTIENELNTSDKTITKVKKDMIARGILNPDGSLKVTAVP
jgi:hypothetical protein